MESIKNGFKSFGFQVISFLQEMPGVWFITIWMVLFAATLLCIINFFKKYNGTQNHFEKVSLIIIAVICMALLMWITYVRK
ncbi:MAG: hypothetical protein IKM43_01975 [Clostridia bacterium]|nr:hypothetical protein [Clostridia bacterium]